MRTEREREREKKKGTFFVCATGEGLESNHAMAPPIFLVKSQGKSSVFFFGRAGSWHALAIAGESTFGATPLHGT
jgi:hypothetical protein